MALTAAVTLEFRDDASRVQHHAAVAALRKLAEAARLLMAGSEHVDGDPT
ncbi:MULTISPECIES: hypothetical protein [unclassified Methylobacterium]|jgi:hypothetical protein|nr:MULTISPECIES: hypothetical protein [unclassified Methylobacterium]SFV12967.1 hypothetical protein SAMN02799643_05798 [Methylobacterium sp. UNCCL125]